MPASSSMADRRATMTFFCARRREPTASVDVHTTSMAMGMDATRMTITTESERMNLEPPVDAASAGVSLVSSSFTKMMAHMARHSASRMSVMRKRMVWKRPWWTTCKARGTGGGGGGCWRLKTRLRFQPPAPRGHRKCHGCRPAARTPTHPRDHGGGLAEEGVGARGDDDRLGLAALDGGAHLQLLAGLDVDGQRLARQRGLVHLHLHLVHEQHGVRGHHVAQLELNEVAGHQVLGGHVLPAAVAAHVALGRQLLLERRDRVAGVALLDVAHRRVGELQHQQHAKVLPAAVARRRLGELHDRGDPDHDGHGTCRAAAAARGERQQRAMSGVSRASAG